MQISEAYRDHIVDELKQQILDLMKSKLEDYPDIIVISTIHIVLCELLMSISEFLVDELGESNPGFKEQVYDTTTRALKKSLKISDTPLPLDKRVEQAINRLVLLTKGAKSRNKNDYIRVIRPIIEELADAYKN